MSASFALQCFTPALLFANYQSWMLLSLVSEAKPLIRMPGFEFHFSRAFQKDVGDGEMHFCSTPVFPSTVPHFKPHCKALYLSADALICNYLYQVFRYAS